MKVKELLELQEVITKKATPSDMDVDNLEQHYSTSKDEHINILDMDLIHLIRSYSKCLGMGKVFDKELVRQKLDIILQDTYNAREILDKTE